LDGEYAGFAGKVILVDAIDRMVYRENGWFSPRRPDLCRDHRRSPIIVLIIVPIVVGSWDSGHFSGNVEEDRDEDRDKDGHPTKIGTTIKTTMTGI
jgi:hypothetical protein